MTEKLPALRVSLKSFETLPKEEQAFIHQALHIMNEIDILIRGIYASMNDNADLPPLQRTAQTSQASFFIKMLAGKLYEAWLVLQKMYFNKLSKKYDSQIPQTSQDALGNLKKYFAQPDNLILDIRRKYAFHYDPDRIREALEGPNPNEHLTFVLPGESGYGFSDLSSIVADSSMLAKIDPDPAKAVKRFMEETMVEVTDYFILFAHGLIAHISESLDYEYVEEEAEGLPALDQIHLPFFAMRKQQPQPER